MNYADKVGEGIEFLIAFGSIMGLLILILGIMGLVLLSSRARLSCLYITFFGFILMAFCGGPATGLMYFNVL